MDKNQYIGLILMFGLLAVYFLYFSPEPPVATEEPTQPAAQAAPLSPQPAAQPVTRDSSTV